MNGGHKDPICEEWKRKREEHPFFGENKTEDDIKSMWDVSAENYSCTHYGEIRDKIIDRLMVSGILDIDTDVLDIGCGPGTYAIPMSGHARSILCVDSSPNMLSRLKRECESMNIQNISCLEADCLSIPAHCKRDLAFCSLCPPMNYPESILMMEGLADETCAYVSSANIGGSIETEIWSRLGKNYSYEGYYTDYPFEYLRSVGRDPTVEYFSQDVEDISPAEDVVERICKLFSRYRPLTDDLKRTIEDVIDIHSENGDVVQKKTMTLGLLVWNPIRIG